MFVCSPFSLIRVSCFINLCYAPTSYAAIWSTVLLCYVILASSSIPTIYDVLSYDKLLNDYISLKAASLYPVLTIDFFVSSQLRSTSHTSSFYYANASDVLRQFRPCNWQRYTIIYARLSATITPYAATNSIRFLGYHGLPHVQYPPRSAVSFQLV